MPTGFRRPINVTFFVPTVSGSLVEQASGVNTAGQVGIDKEQGDGTGFTNYFTEYEVSARYSPKTLQRYDQQAGGYRFLGECSLALDTSLQGLVDSGSYITFNNVDWSYKQLDELGVGFGTDRLILALIRKRTS